MENDLISREALKKKLQARHDNGEEDFDKGYNIGIETAIDLIDNAPAVEAFTENDKALAYCEGYVRGSHEAYIRPQGDIRWTDKLSVTSSGDIIDFEGRVLGHINLEDVKGEE